MARQSLIRTAFLLGGVAALAGCEAGQPLAFLGASGTGTAAAGAGAEAGSARASKTVERDVEAPEIFSANGPGLWDGRPSLGGVWVAHPDVKEPERVIIRNAGSDKFVVGALFRRERATPGPKIQVSSDAAEALGMLAGAPAELSVIALKREEAPAAQSALVEGPVIEGSAIAGADASAAPGTAIKAETIAATSITPVGDIAATAGAALAKAQGNSTAPASKPEARPAAKPAAPQTAAKPAASQAAPKQPADALAKPYIQLGIFSVEANATRAQSSLQKAGLGAKLIKEDWQNKTFWRVLGGPAATQAERDALHTKIKGMGFPDSYAVSK